MYQNFFVQDKLRNELRFVYSDPSFSRNSDHLLNSYNFIEENSLHDYISQIYKVLSRPLRPAKSASVERSFSILNRIKPYARNTISQTLT